MITSSWQDLVTFRHLISNEGDNNKCYVGFVFWKVFKNPIKLLTSPFLVMLQTFLLEEHSKGTWALRHSKKGNLAHQRHSKGTPRALQGNSKGTRALKAFGHLGIQAPKALGYSKAIWTLGYSRHLGMFSKLFLFAWKKRISANC